VVGQGHFGRVYKAELEDKDLGSESTLPYVVAVKEVEKARMQRDKQLEHMKNEKQVLFHMTKLVNS